MTTYATTLFSLIKSDEFVYYKLIIDDVCYYDLFEEELRKSKRDFGSLKGVLGMMERFSSKVLLPKSKFRRILDVGRGDVYEFKKDAVRVYVILQKPNIYVVTGSRKNDQSKTIKRMGKRIKDFKKEV